MNSKEVEKDGERIIVRRGMLNLRGRGRGRGHPKLLMVETCGSCRYLEFPEPTRDSLSRGKEKRVTQGTSENETRAEGSDQDRSVPRHQKAETRIEWNENYSAGRIRTRGDGDM